jgi:hypothetical protein
VSSQDDWADRLAEAIASQLSESTLGAGENDRPGQALPIQVHSIKIKSPDVVEVIFSNYGDLDLKGVRIDSASVRLGPEWIRLSSVGEIALLLINLALLEPRSIDEFLPPDSAGVRWLPAHRWLEG